MLRSIVISGIILLCGLNMPARGQEQVWPAGHWAQKPPAEAGLAGAKLEELARLVRGRGCVVRHGCLVYAWGDVSRSGDVASAMKPVLSTLMLLALQDGKINSVDEPIVRWQPGLARLNGGKDAKITWRHLASQTSGYGLAEAPGQAWSYNDFALALYHDTLFDKVYATPNDEVLKQKLGDVLGFEDKYTFQAFGPKDRPGRLALSVRDFARFGLLYLRNGKWKDKQVLREDLVRLALTSIVPASLPRTRGKEADMLPGQRSIGGTRNITPRGPGQYSFNWWINAPDADGALLFPELPRDTCVASGHGGKRELYVIPSWDLIVVWNDAPVKEGKGPGIAGAAKLMREAVQQ